MAGQGRTRQQMMWQERIEHCRAGKDRKEMTNEGISKEKKVEKEKEKRKRKRRGRGVYLLFYSTRQQIDKE